MFSINVFVSFLLIFVFSGLSFLVYVFFKQKDSTFVKKTPDNLDKSIENQKKIKEIAVVKCSPIKAAPQFNLIPYNKIDCALYLKKYGKNDFCGYGCLGYGSCAKICPDSAIIIKNNTAVITESCIACGLCVDVCPQNLIEIVKINSETFKQCNLPENEKNPNCSAGCISCGKCKTEDFLLEYCPHMCQKKAPVLLNKSFKFWQFCYNIINRANKK